MPFSICGRDHNLFQIETHTETNTPSPKTGKLQLYKYQLQQGTQSHKIIPPTQHDQTSLPQQLVTAGRTDHHPLTKNKKLHIATLNTRTLRTPESLLELEEALKNLNWDILGISEMRKAGEAIEEHLMLCDTGYVIFNKGETGGQRGGGFMVKTHLKNILDFIGVTDRIAILHIKISTYKKIWTVIQTCTNRTSRRIRSQIFLQQFISNHK